MICLALFRMGLTGLLGVVAICCVGLALLDIVSKAEEKDRVDRALQGQMIDLKLNSLHDQVSIRCAGLVPEFRLVTQWTLLDNPSGTVPEHESHTDLKRRFAEEASRKKTVIDLCISWRMSAYRSCKNFARDRV